MKLLLAILISALLGVVLAVVMFLPGRDSADSQHEGSRPSVPVLTDDLHDSRRTAIVRAAEEVGEAVVSISVIQTRVVRTSPRLPFRDRFFEQFFRDFFGEREYVEQLANLGSGVIISGDGLVVTNEHVVRGATEIKVTLTDGREFDGTAVAADQEYDIALLRIEGRGLPYARMGDSDSLIIGEWAIALGNPFGYLLADTHPSVTAGVISALHRDVTTSEGVLGVYKDMIQTDAAINPGNSGGPLVNSLGEIVGINTFILTKSGGSLGIGFAIPVNRVKYVVGEVKQYGRIREIWIGLLVQEITPLIARSLGLESTEGVIVSQTDQGSPADKAGLKRRDIIVKVNGQPVKSYETARRAIFGAQVGDRLEFEIVREGDTKTVTVLVEEAPSE